MASAHVIVRRLPSGSRRYLVRYRLGGRESRLRHGGSFATRREADARVRTILADLAERRVPDLAIVPPAPPEPLSEVAERWLASRIDVRASTIKVHRQAIMRLGRLSDMAPGHVRPQHVQEWIADQHDLAPSSVRKYLDALRLLLDFAEVEPNPARSPRLRLPQLDAEEVSPPSHAEFAALLEAIVPRFRLHLEVLERTALRVGELQQLRWGDLDFRRGLVRVARGRTKGRTAGRRLVPLPAELAARLEALVPREDRDMGAPVLPGWTDDGLRNAMIRAARLAGIPVSSPHDLRHRRISLWVLAGVPLPVVRQLAGHSRASLTADVYSHVLLDEPEWVLRQASRDASVMHGNRFPETEKPRFAGLLNNMEDTGLEPVTFALPARRSPN